MPDRRALTARELELLRTVDALGGEAGVRQLRARHFGKNLMLRLLGWGLLAPHPGTVGVIRTIVLTPAGRAVLTAREATEAAHG